MARSKQKKRRKTGSGGGGSNIKYGFGKGSPVAKKSKQSQGSSDFDAEAANLKSRISGPKKMLKTVSLAQPTFVAPSVQAEEAEKIASEARQERVKMLLGDGEGGDQSNTSASISARQHQPIGNRFFGLDVDGEIMADEGARVSLSEGILSSVVVRDDDDEL